MGDVKTKDVYEAVKKLIVDGAKYEETRREFEEMERKYLYLKFAISKCGEVDDATIEKIYKLAEGLDKGEY